MKLVFWLRFPHGTIHYHIYITFSLRGKQAPPIIFQSDFSPVYLTKRTCVRVNESQLKIPLFYILLVIHNSFFLYFKHIYIYIMSVVIFKYIPYRL